MKMLRTLALVATFAASAASPVFANERQALENYVSPAPSLMPVLVKHADEMSLSAEQQAKLADWRRAAQANREKLEHEIVADRLAINQAMLDGKSNSEVQKSMKALQRKETKLVVGKLACRDFTRKTLNQAQWEKVVALYAAP